MDAREHLRRPAVDAREEGERLELLREDVASLDASDPAVADTIRTAADRLLMEAGAPVARRRASNVPFRRHDPPSGHRSRLPAAQASGPWRSVAEAMAPYVRPVSGVEDLKVAPFHVLASEGRVWFDRDPL